MQQRSVRRSAVGQWLDEEQSLGGAVRQRYGQLPEPDESDKETFDLYFAVGSLLSQGKAHEAGVLLVRLEKRIARGPTQAAVVASDDESGTTDDDVGNSDEEEMNWVTPGGDDDSEEPNWVTPEPNLVTPGAPSNSASSPQIKQATPARADSKPSLDEGDLARHKTSGVDIKKVLQQVKVQAVIVDAKNLGPMGEAQPNYEPCQFPRVEVIKGDDGKFRLRPTSANHDASAHLCKLADVGEEFLGMISSADEGSGMVTMHGGGNRFVTNGVKKEWAMRQLFRGVDKAARRQIEIREFEHLLDFAYAFALATEQTVKVVNALAASAFDSEDLALETVTDRLKGYEQLIPQDYRRPEAWTERALVVARLLAGGSKTRDTEGHHSPKGFEAFESGKTVILRPVFKDESFLSPEIIKLADVATVYAGFKATKAVAPGLKTKLSGRVLTDVCDKPEGKPLETQWLEAGLAVTVVQPGKGGAVWACARAIDVDPLNGELPLAMRLPEEVHFLISTEFLG